MSNWLNAEEKSDVLKNIKIIEEKIKGIKAELEHEKINRYYIEKKAGAIMWNAKIIENIAKE